MSNVFILSLLEDRLKPTKVQTRLANVIKSFNKMKWPIKISFKNDFTNNSFRIRNPYLLTDHKVARQTKENMLRGHMTSIEQAINIYHLLHHCIVFGIEGDVVELGCHEGVTSLLLQMTMAETPSDKTLHVYDSFEGLPEPHTNDGKRFKKGQLATTQEAFEANFKRYKLDLPVIQKGWFADTLPTKLPGKICFAHLDGDFYKSILESLKHVYPRMASGGVIVIDDYFDPKILNVNPILPGVKKACDEFFSDKPEKVQTMLAGYECHGYIRKR
jgi:O-methyltransferase